MVRLIAFCTLFAAALIAADVKGAWRGVILTEMARETTGGQIPAYMVLEQVDGKVSGSAGRDEKMLFRIRDGRIERYRLIVETSPKEGSVLRFDLRVKGDSLEGEVAENGRIIGTAKLKKER